MAATIYIHADVLADNEEAAATALAIACTQWCEPKPHLETPRQINGLAQVSRISAIPFNPDITLVAVDQDELAQSRTLTSGLT